MKKFLKHTFQKLMHPVMTRLGYSAPAPTETNLLESFFQLLRQVHFNPQHIVDVGANHGGWTTTALRYFPDAQYSLLEPQSWLESHLSELLKKNTKIKFYPIGAGSKGGSFKFTIAGRDDSSTFFLTAEQASARGLKQIDVEVVALNDFIVEKKLPVPDIIKIDAEGLDLEVLSGASNFFGKTEVFMVEAAVVAREIQNDISSVIEFMKANGYRLFDITDLNRPFDPKVLWLVELVFVRKNGLIESNL